MRIALINKTFSERGGGGERYAVDLARELDKLGCELHIFGNVLDNLPSAAQRYHLPMIKKPGWLRLLSFNHAVKKALAKHRDKFDVTYALTPVFPVDACFLGGGINRHWLNLRFKNKLLQKIYPLISHNHWAQNYLENNLLKSQNCRCLITNSQLIKQHVIDYGNVAPAIIHVIHNGIDTERFNLSTRAKFRDPMRAQLNLRDDDLAIIYVAHNWERKGLATIIRAVAMTAEKLRFKIIVAGRGKPAPYQKLSLSCGLTENQLHFCGNISEPEKLYAAGDLTILPTQYDPCASVILEAMACGIPAISTQQNGASELITPEKNGFIMNDYDEVKSLSNYLQILTDHQRRQTMGEHAAKAMQTQTFNNVAERTLAVLRGL